MDKRNDLDDSSASRTITNAIRNDKPEEARDEAVYGDTDANPNADDQKDAHHADADEHL